MKRDWTAGKWDRIMKVASLYHIYNNDVIPLPVAVAYDEHDAHLIAAATDMIEALIEIYTMMLAGMEPVIDDKKIESIIEAATGQSIADVMEDK